ncbi:YfhO family protein, partial [Limosilactobacillus reuteri]
QGTIKTTRPGVLTSSIPYSTGWSVKVNGKKATTLRTNQAFLGVYLPAGTHHVTFSYELPGIKLGVLLSLIGLGWTILAGIITIGWERKHK